MGHETDVWPYAPTLIRLALASAIGLFIGIERERRRKEAGLRTFAFAALLGAAGGLLGDRFALLALGLIGVLVIFLNVETIHTGEGAEITTSAALMITGFAGVLAGQGHTFTPTVLGIATAALLAWKEPLAGFSVALTDSEFRSAILLAIVAFVVYPVLPTGSVDPWHLVEPRTAWITVILIAALGFTNYVLLKLYGARGIELTGFLGGLVNSTVTVAELAKRVNESNGALAGAAFKGVMLATAAMLIRNAVILTLFAPSMVGQTVIPMALMFVTAAGAAWLVAPGPSARPGVHDGSDERTPIPALASPFSLTAAIQFGLVFLALEIGGTLGQRILGDGGFLTVSVIGGAVSSASAVASAATLASAGTVPTHIAATGAIIASATSALADWPIVARVGRHAELTRRVRQVLWAIVALGCAGAVIQRFIIVNQAHSVARSADESVGFEEIRIGYGDEPELKGGVWFPTAATATPHAIGSATLNVALGAQPKGRALPLIVLSHGGGGSFEGHHDTAMALAQAGFVAAAITHAGDSYEDQSRVLELWRRPDQLARLVSHMLGRWQARDRIDASRVGAFGFSNGGFTALVMAGGIPNLSTIEPYCSEHPTHDLCTALDRAGIDMRFARSIEPGRWVHDGRIRAAVIAAPAFGFAFDEAGLQAVRIPVQLWGAADDRHQPPPHYEDVVRDNLPREPEFHRVDNAGHYDFLPPCGPSLAKAAPDICTSASGFDRSDFHRRFNAAVVAFFRRTLK